MEIISGDIQRSEERPTWLDEQGATQTVSCEFSWTFFRIVSLRKPSQML